MKFFQHLRRKTLPAEGSRDGAVVRALASHQCVPGSIPGPGVICGLSLLLVLYSAPRGFSPVTPIFPSPQKPTFPNFNSIWNARTFLNEFLWTPWCSVGKQITFFYIYILWYLRTNGYLKPWRDKTRLIWHRSVTKRYTSQIYQTIFVLARIGNVTKHTRAERSRGDTRQPWYLPNTCQCGLNKLECIWNKSFALLFSSQKLSLLITKLEARFTLSSEQINP